MNIMLSNSVNKSDYSTTELQKLQNKCNTNQVNGKNAGFERIQSIIRTPAIPLLNLGQKNIVEGSQPKNILHLLTSLAAFRWMQAQTYRRDFSGTFVQLWVTVKSQMHKHESLENKLARKKRFETRKVEKSEKASKKN